MDPNNIQYYSSRDGHSYYRVNFTKKSVIRICNSKRTLPSFNDFKEHQERGDLMKIKKRDWRSKENEYYSTAKFEWEYKGDMYATSEVPYNETPLQLNQDPKWNKSYPHLVFHNGQIWATGYFGNYYPQMPLLRVLDNGETIMKWTNVKNVRNFIKYSNLIK